MSQSRSCGDGCTLRRRQADDKINMRIDGADKGKLHIIYLGCWVFFFNFIKIGFQGMEEEVDRTTRGK